METEKTKHFLAGLAICLALGYYDIWTAYAISCLVGIGKEIIWDKLLKYGTCDLKDAILTALGASAGILWIYIIKRLNLL